ncbi:MAG: lipid II:glycine glycyltransferase FemX [Pseudonocardiaceae bacterium]
MAHQLPSAAGREDRDQVRLRSTTGCSQRQGTVSVTLFTQPGPDTIRAWDRLVDDTPGGDVTQLSAWPGVRRRAGFLPLYLLAWQDDRLVGGALVLQRHVPTHGLVGYLQHGPMIATWGPRAATVHALSTALAELGRRHLAGLIVAPPEGADDVSDRFLELGFRPSAAGIAPESSTRIDLAPDVEDLRDGLTTSTRRGAGNRADRDVTVRLGCERDLPVLTDLLAHDAEHQHVSLDYLATLYQELAPGAHVQVLIAELDGVVVAAELFTVCGGVLKARLKGIQHSGPARRSGADATLEWHAMLWAKAKGCHTFDHGGLPASFGGRPFHYPAQVELIGA